MRNKNLDTATLRLFNGLYLDGPINPKDIWADWLLMSHTFERGYVLHHNFGFDWTKDMLDNIDSYLGLSFRQGNATLFESWDYVKNTSDEVLFIEQIKHYLSTYGQGIDNATLPEFIYIPAREYEIGNVELDADIKLVVISPFTRDDVLVKVQKLVNSGIALSSTSLDDIMYIVDELELSPSEILQHSKNRELNIRLYDKYDIAPSKPIDFLRYVVYKLTGSTLLIKNKYTYNKLVAADAESIDEYIRLAPIDLASIYYRFKPLFLAMRKASTNKAFFNRLARQAKYLHKPMKVDLLNDVTKKLRTGENVLTAKFYDALSKANIFRLVRLANVLLLYNNLVEGDNILYSIRNGKAYLKEFKEINNNRIFNIYWSILDVIVERLDVKDRDFYIPRFINYSLPRSEKSFVGNFPTGTNLTLAPDCTIGLHWYNTDKVVDLDLSSVSKDKKIGWNSSKKTISGGVLYSGDVTSAPQPDGAGEYFKFSSRKEDSEWLMFVNYYYYQDGDSVDAKLIIEENSEFAFDPNKTVMKTTFTVDKPSSVIGYLLRRETHAKFVFIDESLSNSCVSSSGGISDDLLEYFNISVMNQLRLVDILQMAGARIHRTRPEEIEYIDLAPEDITKQTFIDLFTPNSKP